MADVFDPYHKWLGIAPDDRPPTYYRLLGVALFETDPDVLQNGADQRMAHVRSFQSGSHAAEAQQILNELAKAAHCLLSASERTIYDQQLRQSMLSVDAPISPPPNRPPRPDAATSRLPPRVSVAPARVSRRSKSGVVDRIRQSPLATSVALIVVAASAFGIWSFAGSTGDGSNTDRSAAVEGLREIANREGNLSSKDSGGETKQSDGSANVTQDEETPPEGVPADSPLSKRIPADDLPTERIVEPKPVPAVDPHLPMPDTEENDTTQPKKPSETVEPASELWLKAQLAVAKRDVDTAKTLLGRYVEHPESDQRRTEAQQLLSEVQIVMVDEVGLSASLQKLTDEQLTNLEAESDEPIAGITLNNATLTAIYLERLRPLIPAERERRAAAIAKANEGFRIWSSRDGKLRLDAKVVGMDGTNLVFRDREGKETTVAWSRFSAADQGEAISAATMALKAPKTGQGDDSPPAHDPKRLHRLVSEFQRKSKLATQVEQKRRELIALSRLTEDSRRKQALLDTASSYKPHLALFRQELAALQLQIQEERDRK
ncbi:MAG: hypothetical protein MI757_12855 [Pirellulales bacterium]|nr:hypothetical protein [Pirellulales bacterium]